jgi:CHAT domain-containing protein
LHLATHGFFIAAPDIPNPFLRVGIALSGAKASALAGEEYGLLTALQLSALRLSGTELVVLSACETALGDVVAGEGVAGLNQAFFTAGARRVMLSLWKVPDQETAILMERFYQLWIGGSSVEEALRQTKLELMRQGLEPLKWAAFVLNGG